MTYSRPKARKFLSDYFNDNELTNLCFDYFPLVENNFSLGMPKDQKIRELLVYCENRGKTSDLLAALERERPELFEAELHEDSDPPSHIHKVPVQTHNPNQVFLSHSSDDGELAHGLAAALRRRGWEIWIAPDSILPGEKWVEAINRGLEESGIFVLLMTDSVMNSRWVKNETNAAIGMEHEGKIRFIPLAHEDVDIPPLWRSYQWVDFAGLDQENVEKVVSVLDGRTATRPSQKKLFQKRQPTEKSPREISLARLPSWVWGAGIIVLILLALGILFRDQLPFLGPSDEQLKLMDSDGDNISDYNEINHVRTDPYKADTDEDGIDDNDEQDMGLKPLKPDTDSDGLLDGDEVNKYQTQADNPDTDGDDLSDGDEVNIHQTDPNKADTDEDGLSDGIELTQKEMDPLSSELHVHWLLDEGVGATEIVDRTGNFAPGKIFGGIDWVEKTTQDSPVNSSLRFNGDDTYIELPDLSFESSFSISLWIHPTGKSSGEDYSILINNVVDQGETNSFMFGLHGNRENSACDEIKAQDGNSRNLNYVYLRIDSSLVCVPYSPDEQDYLWSLKDRWGHIAVTAENQNEGTIATFYLNGNPIGEPQLLSGWSALNDSNKKQKWSIGQDFDGNELEDKSDYFKGSMANFRIYDVALSAEAIQHLASE